MPGLLEGLGSVHVQGGSSFTWDSADPQCVDDHHEPGTAGFARERSPQGLGAVCREQRLRASVRVRGQHGVEPGLSTQRVHQCRKRGRSERHVTADDDTDLPGVVASPMLPTKATDVIEAGGDPGDRSPTGRGLAAPLDRSRGGAHLADAHHRPARRQVVEQMVQNRCPSEGLASLVHPAEATRSAAAEDDDAAGDDEGLLAGHQARPRTRRVRSVAVLMTCSMMNRRWSSVTSAAGYVTAIPATGWPTWSSTGAATEAKSGVTVPSSTAKPSRRTRDNTDRSPASVVGPTPWRCTKVSREGKRARTCCGGREASMAKPLAVSCDGSRTPTSVTSGGRPGARSAMT